MLRLLFEKKENAIWISHLDLMRLFQRTFKRAGLTLKHTQGFNPRPSVSIALPLSVGVSSSCELLDFELDEQIIPCDEIKSRLNENLVEGITVLDVYENGRKYRDLGFLECIVTLEYDSVITEETCNKIKELFSRDALVLPKKTKNGIQDQDINPMIKALSVEAAGDKVILLTARICCQNPTLNPNQLILAIQTFLPEAAPVFSKCQRIEIFDHQNNIFR